MAEDTADFETSDVHLLSLHSPRKRSTAFTASWSVTTSEKTECSLHSFRVCADTLARPSVVAMLHSKKRNQCYPKKSQKNADYSYLHLPFNFR